MMDLLKFLQTVPPNYKVSIVKDMRMPATFKETGCGISNHVP